MSEIDTLAKANALLISGIINELVQVNIFTSENVSHIHEYAVNNTPSDEPVISEYLLANLKNSLNTIATNNSVD